MERVSRFLHDWRVNVEVSELPPHVDLDVRFSYHIKATWEKNREVVELAKMAEAESRKYVGIWPTYVNIYAEQGRLDFDVSEGVLKGLRLEVTK